MFFLAFHLGSRGYILAYVWECRGAAIVAGIRRILRHRARRCVRSQIRALQAGRVLGSRRRSVSRRIVYAKIELAQTLNESSELIVKDERRTIIKACSRTKKHF